MRHAARIYDNNSTSECDRVNLTRTLAEVFKFGDLEPDAFGNVVAVWKKNQILLLDFIEAEDEVPFDR